MLRREIIFGPGSFANGNARDGPSIVQQLGPGHRGIVVASITRGRVSAGKLPAWPRTIQRITELIWWGHHTGSHSAEALRLGKQDTLPAELLPLSYTLR